jgi:hypothetical protein
MIQDEFHRLLAPLVPHFLDAFSPFLQTFMLLYLIGVGLKGCLLAGL